MTYNSFSRTGSPHSSSGSSVRKHTALQRSKSRASALSLSRSLNLSFSRRQLQVEKKRYTKEEVSVFLMHVHLSQSASTYIQSMYDHIMYSEIHLGHGNKINGFSDPPASLVLTVITFFILGQRSNMAT